MALMLIVNPANKPSKRKRKGVLKMAKRRTAAQRAATKKMLQARWGVGGRTKVKRKRRKNPISVVHKASGKPVSKATWRASGYRRNPVRRRRNPIASKIGGLKNIVSGSIIPAATAATGAVALDALWGFLPVPDTIKAGPLRHVAKGAGAIAIGLVAGMVTSKETAKLLSSGALTVVMYNAIREAVARFAPNLQLGELLVDSPEEMGLLDTNMGMQMDGVYDTNDGNVYDMDTISGVSDEIESY